ncbi:hypothetical protein BST81_11865 [Leptolyngbya sp. 'hensonii']|nr:hypothetical protein BST81_11865 [Leptolyngbya sp. 'hensonii']
MVALLGIATLALLGLQLPTTSSNRLVSMLYTSLGFGLSWMTVLSAASGLNFFPVLLLVVVVRACILFPWSGRILVALAAYTSYLVILVLRIRPPETFSAVNNSTSDPLRFLFGLLQSSVFFNLFLNSALLFGLVLIFVLLLVGALLGEYESRQELAQANDRLREYALLIEDQAILQERNRIAREIHDSVGHNLTAQSIHLENVAQFLGQDQEQADRHLQKARQLGTNALRDVRQSIAALRSHPLQKQSLQDALTHLLREFEQTTQIRLKAQIRLTIMPATEIAIALYRIIQEALTNIAKHSQASRVHLFLSNHAMGFSLKIEDNGRGFNPEENTTGFGLQGIHERAAALGGTVTLQSRLNQGCTLTVEIPRQHGTHDSGSARR